MAKKIPDGVKEFVFELWDYGYKQKEIAMITELSESTVQRFLREKVDFKELQRIQYEEKFKNVEQMYLDGMSASQIAKEQHLSAKNVREHLKKLGYEILKDGRKYTFNYDYFEVIDTEEKAYWLGFLYADGCVGKNRKDKTGEHPGSGVDLQLKRTDETHIDKLIEAVNYNGPKRYKEIKLNGNTYYSCSVALTSVKMADDLIKLGCVPAKSLILKFPTKEQVSYEFLFHFIRGYVDGDGCIRLTYRNGANGNKLYHAHLDICGTPEFLEGMLDRTGWDRTQIHHDKRSNACGVGWMGSIKCVKYLHQLYNDATIYLDRKYELYLEIIAVLGGNI